MSTSKHLDAIHEEIAKRQVWEGELCLPVAAYIGKHREAESDSTTVVVKHQQNIVPFFDAPAYKGWKLYFSASDYPTGSSDNHQRLIRDLKLASKNGGAEIAVMAKVPSPTGFTVLEGEREPPVTKSMLKVLSAMILYPLTTEIIVKQDCVIPGGAVLVDPLILHTAASLASVCTGTKMFSLSRLVWATYHCRRAATDQVCYMKEISDDQKEVLRTITNAGLDCAAARNFNLEQSGTLLRRAKIR